MKKYFHFLIFSTLFLNITNANAQLDSIYYHDGAFESQWGSSTGNDQFRLFVRVTPNNYPSTLKGIRAYFRNAAVGATFKWCVYKDLAGLAAGGVTQMYLSPNPLPNPAAGGIANVAYEDYIDLTSANLSIASGDYYVGVSESNNNGFLGLAMDQLPATSAYDNRQWQFMFGGWNTMVSQASSGQFGITAFFPQVATTIGENFQTAISVYPNPVIDNCTITLPDNFAGISAIRIMNMQGEIVYQEEINSTSAIIDLENLVEGIYILSIQNKNQILNRKIVRQ